MPEAKSGTAGASLLGGVGEFVGKEGPPHKAAEPVNPAMIREWCDALSDHNPVYIDPARAERSVHGGIVAPPAMLGVWGATRGSDGPFAELLKRLDAAGFTAVVATDAGHEYDRYLRPGDHLTGVVSAADFSEEKQTALGRGYFLTMSTELRCQNGLPVGRAKMRILKFKPGTARASQSSGAEPGGPRPGSSRDTHRVSEGMDLGEPRSQRRPQHTPRRETTLSFDEVAVGNELPPCPIPVTRTLIISGATASRDSTPLHHDTAAARAQGAPDIFMNILTTYGLCARYVTDWAGPDARLRRLAVRLGAPNYPGDTMTFSGSVAARVPAERGGFVEVALRGPNSLGDHVTGTVALELPAGQ